MDTYASNRRIEIRNKIKVTRKCHPEAKPKDIISGAIKRFFAPLRSAQNDSFAVTLGTLVHLILLRTSDF